MPKSKRAKVYHLSKTKKKGRTIKDKLITDLRECCDKYERVIVFKAINMRNNGLKALRSHWADSRIFMGKNKVMGIALGRSPEEAHKDNSDAITAHISGGCALLFTNEKAEDVYAHLASVDELHYARAGFVATEDFELEEGVVPMPFSMETQLRKLGLPTILKEGKILLNTTIAVCRAGDRLTPEQCRLLELFQIQMARFKVYAVCKWESKDGAFEDKDPPAYVAELAAAGPSQDGWMSD